MPFVCDYLCLCCVVFGVVLVDFRLFDLGVSLVSILKKELNGIKEIVRLEGVSICFQGCCECSGSFCGFI